MYEKFFHKLRHCERSWEKELVGRIKFGNQKSSQKIKVEKAS
jgi:hypothetical protein